jgi:NAD(P)-dependent dehydrogenase (short-subunit alcohol dehydrogenase family)
MAEHHKVAVVTGSALNIGRATALALARDGFRVMVTARVRRTTVRAPPR